VGDEDQRDSPLLVEGTEEPDNRTLGGDIERADRLVAEKDGRPGGEGTGDAHALPLAPAEGVGLAVEEGWIEPDGPQQVRCLGLEGVPPRGVLPHGNRLPEDPSHGMAGIQAVVGILENHLQVACPGPAGFPPLVEHREGPGAHLAPRVGFQAGERPDEGGLAAPALPDDPEPFPRGDRKVQRGQALLAPGIGDGEGAGLEDGRGSRRRGARSSVAFGSAHAESPPATGAAVKSGRGRAASSSRV